MAPPAPEPGQARRYSDRRRFSARSAAGHQVQCALGYLRVRSNQRTQFNFSAVTNFVAPSLCDLCAFRACVVNSPDKTFNTEVTEDAQRLQKAALIDAVKCRELNFTPCRRV